MADTDTPKTTGKPLDSSASETGAHNSTGATPPSSIRAEAQAGDPYRPADGTDYALSIEPEDTGEATVANLFQAVPLDYEGSGGALYDGEGLSGDGGLNGGMQTGMPKGGMGLGQTGNVQFPDGQLGVVETSGGAADGGGGSGGGDAPQARGLDASLPEFDLGGSGISSAGSTVGNGIGGGGGGTGDGDSGVEIAADDGGEGGTGDGGADGGGSDDGDGETGGGGTGGGGSGGGGEGGGDGDGSPIGLLEDINPADNTITENAVEGTTVGVVAFADDPDLGDDVTYEIVGDSPFAIDSVTGVITVGPGAEIDRETTSSIDVTVRATSSDGSTAVETFTVQIEDDTTEFGIGQIADVDAGSNFVEENADSGTVVGVTAFAEDLDATDTVTYEIVGDSPFVIDPATGIITVASGAVIDQEATPFIDVTVKAASTDGSTAQETFRVTVGEDNEYEIGPLRDTDSGQNLVMENSGQGTTVGVTAFAEDLDSTDTVTYEIVGNSPFVIDPETGVIAVGPDADIDFETTPYIDVTVKATSTDGSTSQETFRIEIGDEDDTGVGPVTDIDTSNNDLNAVAENGAGGEVVGITAFAEEPDSGDAVTYSTDDPRFDIDPDTGVLTVKPGVSFDYEQTPTVDVEITATSSDGSSSTGTFLVNILDVNEAPDLMFETGDADGVSATITFTSEGASYSNTFGVFVLDDAGNPVAGQIIWTNGNELTPGEMANVAFPNVEAGDIGYFLIPDGADLNPDIAAGDRVTFQMDGNGAWQAVSESGTPLTGQGANIYFSGDGSLNPDGLDHTVESGVTIGFEDIVNGGDGDFNDFVFEARTSAYDYRTTIVEEVEGAEAAPLSVLDPDAGDTHTFTVSDDRFEVVVSGDKYVLKLKDDQSLDYETETQVTVQVTATDSGGLSDTETIIIDVIDTDDGSESIGPLSDADAGANFVAENAGSGAVVGVTAFASDPDSSDTVTYEIVDPDSPFVIDPDTGVISVAPGAEIDREATPSIDVTVKATSTDDSSTTRTFTIEVGDENEFAIGPVSDADGSRNIISESSAGGEGAGITAFAEDIDATDTVTYELTGGDGRFEIDGNTGVITVADGAQFDAEAEPAIDLTVTATSTDGSSSSKTFSVEVSDGNEAPDLIVHLENGSGEFVINGSFEVFDGLLSGTAGAGWYENPSSIEGWAYTDVDVHQAGHIDFGATDGDHHLDLAAMTNGWASQAIEGQLDGQVYVLSFDMKSRGSIGQSVAEVYWNGELIDTIDPATTGPDWQVYSYTIVGGSGDGSNTLTFVEIGSDNNGGVLIDNVSCGSDNRTAVVEEHAGAEIAPLSVIDPDVGDTHTFAVSDDRFEVVASGDQYMLKLKDDQAFDYETESQVTVEVTVTDQGGLSDTETIVIDVIDVDETNGPIEALVDVDTSDNILAANASGGTSVGLTAYANDPDAGDTVTYSITDPRFEIDPDTGEVTVAGNVDFDPDQTPFIDLEVTATSTDGSSVSETFRIDVTDANTAPDLSFDPNHGAGVSVTLTFVEEAAGYSNVLGVYIKDANGDPVSGQIVWVDQNQLSPGDSETVYLEGVDAGDIGYFLIPDGADLNSGLVSGGSITFEKDGNGNWQAVGSDGTLLAGVDANVYFSGSAALNADGYDHTTEMGVTIGFEDLYQGGDEDFDDVVFEQSVFETNANAAVYEERPGAVVGELTVADPDAGDSHSFTVSDNRFEVVAQNGAYILKLKDGVALDYETEQQVSVNVTVTDSGGLSDTETIVVDVIDVEPEDGSTSVGPVCDTNSAHNLVNVAAAAGAVVGLTAFAEHIDAAVTVTYSIDDSRFDIDANTGVVTVADGVTLTAGEVIDVTIIASSSDGTQSSNLFSIEVGEEDGNTAPDLVVGDAVYDGSLLSGLAANDGICVAEEDAGAGVVSLSVVDPDAGEHHTFSVSDDRFEVTSDGSDYLLKLKDGVALDFEQEHSITLDVTATDSGGLSNTETITLDVIDVQEDSGVLPLIGSSVVSETLIGEDGDDILSGGAGDDTLQGCGGDDTVEGGDGSDLFAYMLGDGNDTIFGGAGENWIDIVDLGDAADIGSYGVDWSVTVTDGSIESVDPLNGEITLSQDSSGHIDLADGSQIDFSDIESIQC